MEKWRIRAEKLKTDLPALYLSLRDKETPLSAKIIAAVAVAYALSPLDIIPDGIPLLGYLDDVLLLPALTALAVKRIPADVWERNRQQARELWKDGKPKKWYYAVPVVLIWALLLWLLIRALLFH